MTDANLHRALRTEIVDTISAAGMSIQRVILQRGKADLIHTLHAEPRTFNISGKITGAHVLHRLGFASGECPFAPSGHCLASAIAESFDHHAFARDIEKVTNTLDQGLDDLLSCGFFVGHEYFGVSGIGKIAKQILRRTGGDGHNAANVRRLKNLEDEYFDFLMTFIDGGRDKGWTFHYLPKQLPVSEELASMMLFLGMQTFESCPEAAFEPCYWRFIHFLDSDDPFRGPTEAVHQWFDAHAGKFSSGVSQLLTAEAIMVPHGMHLLPNVCARTTPQPLARATADAIESRKRGSAGEATAPARFDIAISFAGAQRDLAEAAASIIREAGFAVFYDKYYAAQLWGKDLSVFFDDIFRNRARYCLILVSKEYVDRNWTNHERRSAVARMIAEKGGEYILPVRIDAVELPGLQPTIGYVALAEFSIEEIATMAIEKLKSQKP